MNIEIKDISSVKKEVRVVVPKNIIDDKFETAYASIGKKAKIKGFRVGKAPKYLVKKNYQDSVVQDLFQEIISDAYYKALTENNLHPISEPKIIPNELEEGKDFEFNATFDIKPALTDLQYTDLKLEKEDVSVSDEEVQKEIDNIRNQHSTLKKVDDEKHLVVVGNVVKIDFEGFLKDGSTLENGKAENHEVEVGAGYLIKSLEDGLVGMRLNEEKTIETRFPEDYPKKELQGEKIDFKVLLKEINIKELPEVNEEFIQKLKNYTDVADLKDKTKKDIVRLKQDSANHRLRQNIADKLLEINDFEAPESVVQEQRKRLIEEANMRLAYIGKENLDKYIDENGDNFTKQATSNVKLFFLFEEIANAEKVDVEESDIDAELDKIAEKSSMSTEQVKTYYKKQKHVLEDLRYKLKEDKIYQLIMAKSSVKEVPVKK